MIASYDITGWVVQVSQPIREIAMAIQNVGGGLYAIAQALEKNTELRAAIYKAKQDEDPLALGPM